MGYAKAITYQDRDYEFVDYAMASLPDIGPPLRGPLPADLTPGSYGVCLGAAQTFGACVDRPFPRLLSDALGIPVLNLGFAGAGPELFLGNAKLLELVAHAKFAVVQVMSGRSISSSYFVARGGVGFLKKRSATTTDTSGMLAISAFAELLKSEPIETVKVVVQEMRANWVTAFCDLLDKIPIPKLLFYFSTRMPHYIENYDSALGLMSDFPQLVNEEMLSALRPHADGFVQAISSRGLPQPLVNRFSGEPVVGGVGYQAPSGYNVYYPSPEMHLLAADMLRDPIRKIAGLGV